MSDATGNYTHTGAVHPLIHSGILLAAITAVLLNWFYNGAPEADEDSVREAGHAANGH